jgi:sugar lactone lactonase YvrE
MLRRLVPVLALFACAVAIAAPVDEVVTIAGSGTPGFSGDGGPALMAELQTPYGIQLAPDGTVYFSDLNNFRIRRINVNGTIETVAGNGESGGAGDGGPATSAQLSQVEAIALDPARNVLYLADIQISRVRRVNLTTGTIDGIADIAFPQGIAVDASGTIYVAETLLCRVVTIDPVTFTVGTFAGNGTCDSAGDGGPAAAASFLLPTRLAIDAAGNLFVVETAPVSSTLTSSQIRRIDAITGTVTTVAGGGTLLATSGPATGIDLGLVKDIAVDDAPGGATRLFVAQEFQILAVDLTTGELAPFAGTGVSGYQDGPAATAMFNVIGGVTYGPGGALSIGDSFNNRVRAMTPGGGASDDVTYIGTTLTTIAVNVAQIVGNLTVVNNPQLVSVDLGALLSVGGDVLIVDNGGGATTVDIGGLVSISGNMDVDSSGSGTFDATACAGGSTDIDATGYATVLATTAQSGTTNVTSTNDNSVSVALQPGTFSGCVNFSLTRVAVSPAAGTDASGNPVVVDAIDAYEIEFDLPTLGQPATLTFDIVLANLTPARQIELLEALNTGLVTLVTRSDAPGAVFQTFPVCLAGQQPTVDGCVGLEQLDATGNLIPPPPPGTVVAPAIVRFTSVVGHFSTWGVAIVMPASSPVFFNGLLQPYPAPPHATTPTFQRGSVVPLKFNWVDASGQVIDSAAASPEVAIHRGTCADQPSASPLPAEDAGQSRGWRYDTGSRTWIFGWSTRSLSAGCYWIEITTGAGALPPPDSMFPIALRER